MKSLKELLQLLVDNIEMIDDVGLCWAIKHLCEKDIITINEGIFLNTFLKEFEKEYGWEYGVGYSHSYIKGGLFLWEPGEIEPRLKFLNDEISKL